MLCRNYYFFVYLFFHKLDEISPELSRFFHFDLKKKCETQTGLLILEN